MAVGYIDPEPREKVRPPRKQVLVVVTASWQVLAFDHNLSLMWEVTIEDSLPRNARLAEVGRQAQGSGLRAQPWGQGSMLYQACGRLGTYMNHVT